MIHTKGPWSIRGPSLTDPHSLCILGPEKDSGWQTVLASIHIPNTATAIEAHSNANLMAHAAEMYEALQRIADGTAPSCIGLARVMVAKIKGSGAHES